MSQWSDWRCLRGHLPPVPPCVHPLNKSAIPSPASGSSELLILWGVWEPRIHRQLVRSTSALGPPLPPRLAAVLRAVMWRPVRLTHGVDKTPGRPRQSCTVSTQVEWKQGNRPPGAWLWDAAAEMGTYWPLPQALGLRRTLPPGPLMWESRREPGSQSSFPGSTSCVPRPDLPSLGF